jgi:hypothetical protein
MIGVIASSSEHEVVREFFELFKTPWEFWHEGGNYDVLLSTGMLPASIPREVRLVAIYTSTLLASDVDGQRCDRCEDGQGHIFNYGSSLLPIYGACVTFSCGGSGELTDAASNCTLLSMRTLDGVPLARAGYDLFGEIRHLLEEGQPAGCAAYPSVELHIAILRQLILSVGAGLVEIPPFPAGHAFIACLTHDIDQPSLRIHKFDHTMAGFLYRALAVSLLATLRGKLSVRGLLTNWAAALGLPFVLLGWLPDPWLGFVRYRDIEGDARSTFFVIPRKGAPGRLNGQSAPFMRAARYAVADIAGQLRSLASDGCEIGLHGIDAWCDEQVGREELRTIRGLSNSKEIGVRMHWLYFDKHSFTCLESIGAEYDSTVGYNETVGFRAGTTQVFRPLGATRLLELPLHVMDTALFLAGHLNLSFDEAWGRVRGILNQASRCGGALTINWHDRSIAPERLWSSFYTSLLKELRRRKAWLATAASAVCWFRFRRSAAFEQIAWGSQSLRAYVRADAVDGLPGLLLHIYAPCDSATDFATAASRTPVSVPLRPNLGVDYSFL